ncbi:GNAT family N-acetyltransferase [Brevundimonas sp. TWP2-3-4b1]|uniref:GNAT family N-acetyltransferase n=1 Tax=Brevundimonas sp. TWP2-3-4b1 TaxID=2804580 RepID=UPI003CF0244C
MSAAPVLSNSFRIASETPADREEAEALVMAAFGPGRFAKTAERIRESASIAAAFVARENGRMIGSVRLWSITVDGLDALFLGPIAVAQDTRRGGIGADLVGACLGEAQARGVAGVLLVGDPPYFSRFGFQPAPDVRLPGPADPQRVMWLPIASAAPSGLALAA